MGQRIYTSPIDALTLPTAAGDVISIKTPANRGAQIHHIQFSAGGVTGIAQVRLHLKRGTGTLGGATGGTVVTPAFVDPGDTQAALCVVHVLDTSPATATTFTTLEGFQWNVLTPFDYMAGPQEEDRDIADVSSYLVLDTPATISSTYVISGFCKHREMP